MGRYEGFMNQIPSAVMQKVPKHLYDDFALFKPKTYIAGRLMHSEDFHVIIPSAPPPDTYVNGKLERFTNKKIIVFNPGDSILSTDHGIEREYLSLLIKEDILKRIACEMGLSDDIRFVNLRNPYSGELLTAIGAFCREVERVDSFPMMLDCLVVQIITLILREFKLNRHLSRDTAPNGDKSIDLAAEFMRTFYNSNITIEDICDEIDLSPFHFIRSFKQKYGVSPHQYLMQLRIDKAQEILATGRHSVSETAMLCGFVSLPHFSSTFKRLTGQSPTTFAENHTRSE
jgi:AraC-like DNA-binding protein